VNYNRYFNASLNRSYKRWRRAPGPVGQSVPGNVFDPDPRKDSKHKFDRWLFRSDAAKRVYWRTHPQYGKNGKNGKSPFKYWTELIRV
jgi:hypothetical protein